MLSDERLVEIDAALREAKLHPSMDNPPRWPRIPLRDSVELRNEVHDLRAENAELRERLALAERVCEMLDRAELWEEVGELDTGSLDTWRAQKGQQP